MSIPVGNLYRLLVYAWDALDVAGVASVSAEPLDGPPDLLARVLVEVAAGVLTRGPDRGYVEVTADTRTPRGRVELGDTVRRRLLSVPAVSCTADELTHDRPANRVLVATLRRVGRWPAVARSLRERAAALAARFEGVSDVPLSPAMFAAARPPRTDRRTRLLLTACRFLYDHALPTPGGRSPVPDFARDDRAMSGVFERFVRNFYRREQDAFPTVGGERFDWADAVGDPAALALLPELRTDVCLSRADRKLVIDAKFYAAALSAYHGTPSVHAGNLYQLLAYLRNLRPRTPPGVALDGLLVYPTTDRELDLRYELHGFPVRVATVDLARPWASIRQRMLDLI